MEGKMLIKIIISFRKVFTQVSFPIPSLILAPPRVTLLSDLLREVQYWGLWNPPCHPSCLQLRLLAAELRKELD